MRSKFAQLLATTVALGGLTFVACTDDPAPAAPAARSAQTCLATLQQANGATCFDASVTCDYPITCPDGFFQQARCACNGATFACSFLGEAVPKGSAPACRNTTDTPPVDCPASTAAAEGKACAAIGKQCFFAGRACEDGSAATDVCQCAVADGASVFKCQKRPCPTPPEDAGAGDASDPDAARSDAGDAARTDAGPADASDGGG